MEFRGHYQNQRRCETKETNDGPMAKRVSYRELSIKRDEYHGNEQNWWHYQYRGKSMFAGSDKRERCKAESASLAWMASEGSVKLRYR